MSSDSATPMNGHEWMSGREPLFEELMHEIRAGQRASDKVDEAACRIVGVNRTDGRCMDILEEHGRMTAGQLATAASLSTGAVTAVIDRLERAGYARRVGDPSDRRKVLVELTPECIALLEELMGPLGDDGFPLLARYTDEQLTLVIEFLRTGREIQERHAARLRARLEQTGGLAPPREQRDATASGPRHRAARTVTESAQPIPQPEE
jgi:DNA-binding MarR family transcriptional regulator